MQHLLNLAFLDNRVRELGLKRWWLADQLRVDRKTVTRWFTGSVKSIKLENLVRLAEILGCKQDELLLENAADAFASKDAQQLAARLIEQEDLLNVLAPTGKWPLLEGLIKATMQPDLPLPLLGALYNHLATASWRQSKFAAAEVYATKAFAIGERIGNLAVQIQARLSFGSICSFTGRLNEAQKHLEHVIAHRLFLENERQLGSALNNLAAVQHQRGDFTAAIALQEKANKIFATEGTPMGRSIGWSGLAMSFIEIGSLDQAAAACELSLAFAEAAGHRCGIAFNDILLATIDACRGSFAAATARLTRGIAVIEAMGIKEPMYYVYAARISRLQGEPQTAAKYIARGLACSDTYPIDRADLMLEAWHLDQRPSHLVAVREIYEATGADLRLLKLKLM